MTEKRSEETKISMASTKQQMLKAYNALLKELREREEAELKPEKRLEEKKAKEVVQVAESLSSEGAVTGIGNVKMEIGQMLTQISDKLDEEVNKFKATQRAVEVKEKELQEVYEIERSAAALAALIESQNRKRLEFESEMTTRREKLNAEIDTTRGGWEKEKKDHERQVKERDGEEKKTRERDKEEFGYGFKREKQLSREKFEDEKARLKREIELEKEEMEKDLAEREKSVAQSENELNELHKRVNAFPKELETGINKAIKETTETINLEARNKVELLKKEFDGERNVLTTRIESLDKTVKEQSEQIAKVSHQLENAYQKVQDIAVKAIEGSSNVKSFASFQQLINEQTRKQSEDK